MNPLLDDPLFQAESEKVTQIYDLGYEVYDTADHILHSMVSVGNLLRILGDIMRHREESAALKADETDVKLMMYLEDIEERLSTCGEILAECEDSIRDVRNGLAHIDYKKCIPQDEDKDGTTQATLEVGA